MLDYSWKGRNVKAIETKIGQTEVFLVTCGENIEILQKEDFASSKEKEIKSPYMPTSAGEKVKKVMGDAYAAMKEVLKNISEDIGEHLNSIDLPKRPKQVEMEFSIAVSGEGKLIIINGEAEAGVKVKLTWERDNK